MPKSWPDAVFLIHGTFAHRDEDDHSIGPPGIEKVAAWWQRDSEFVAELNVLLGEHAECWPSEVCAAMPWARPSQWTRLEGLTIGGRKPLEWLRPKQRIVGRLLFAWPGLNSESERRHAGRRLFDGLKELERLNRERTVSGEEPRYYHLVGHSHGGSVIWNALRMAVGRGEDLPSMRSWTTLGTPFPTYGVIPGRWLIGLLGLLTIVVLGWLILGGDLARAPRPTELSETWLTLRALLDPGSPANLFPFGVSPGTRGLLLILLALGVWFAFAIATWALRWLEIRLERRASDEAWRRFGTRWLGLFSEIDEAIAGTQNTVGLYASDLVRIRLPGAPPSPRRWTNPVEVLIALPVRWVLWIVSWVTVPLINGVCMPLAEWVISLVFRLKFQGSDRLGSHLTITSPEPFSRASFPNEPTRGPLPAALAAPLHHLAQEKVQSRVLAVRSRFAQDARSPRSPKDLLRAYFSDMKLTNELIHNSYYDIGPLRRAVAYHIRKTRDAQLRPDDLLSPAPEVRGWLDGEVPASPGLDYLPQSKPSITTPSWTRCLLTAAFILLCLVGFHSTKQDIDDIYLDQLVSRLAATGHSASGFARQGKAALLRRAFEVFRLDAEPRLIKRIVQRDADETSLNGVAFLRDYARRHPRYSAMDPDASEDDSLYPDSIRALLQLVYDGDTDQRVRISTMQTLLAIPNRRLVADLLAGSYSTGALFRESKALQGSESTRHATAAILEHFGTEGISGLVAILKTAEAAGDRRIAAEALGAMGTMAADRGVTPLEEALSDPDAGVRLAATQGLSRMGSQMADRGVEPLISALVDPDPMVRIAAATCLGAIGEASSRAVEVLVPLLRDRDARVRFAAGQALGKIGPLAIAPLSQVLGDRDLNGRAAAAQALAASKALPSIAGAATARISETLAHALREKDSVIRINIIQALERMGPNAAGALVAALGDADADVRASAATALGGIGESAADRAVEPLALAVEDRNSAVRQAAVIALGKMGPLAITPLLRILKDRRSERRSAEATLAGAIGYSAAARLIVALIPRLRGSEPFERAAAARALGEIGSRGAARTVEPLIQALGDESWAIRQAAAQALGAIGRPAASGAVEPLIVALRDKVFSVHNAVEQALVRMGEPAIESLIRALADENPTIRGAIVRSLGAIGEAAAARAVGPLTRELEGNNLMIRLAAAQALARMGKAAIEPLVKGLGDSAISVRIAAAQSLGAIGEAAAARAVEPLMQALQGRDPQLRSFAATSLGRMGSLAVAPVCRMLRDDLPANRIAAGQILAAIGAPAAERGLEALVVAFEDEKEQESVRVPVARALAAIGARAAPRAIAPLAGALRGENATLRLEAAKALGSIGAPALDPLLAALERDNDDVRAAAATALAIMGPPAERAVPHLVSLALVGDANARQKALDALNAIRTKGKADR